MFRQIDTLGATNQRKVRAAFGFRTINAAIEHYAPACNRPRRRYTKRQKDEAYRAMRDEYNCIMVVLQQRERDIERQREIKARLIQSKLTALTRFRLAPTATTFDSYWKYVVPAYHSAYIEKEAHKRMKAELRRQRTPLPAQLPAGLALSALQFAQWQQQMHKFLDPIVAKALLQNKCVKLFAVIKFKCFNIKTEETFEQDGNLGSSIVNSIFEFRDYFSTHGHSKFGLINDGHDYVHVYGLGDVHLHVLKFTPLSGSSYKPLPLAIYKSKSIINIQNHDDDKCFLWCCIASRHLPVKNAERVKQYQRDDYMGEWKFKDADFPMSLNSIIHFEKANRVNISVYTVDSDGKTPVPARVSQQRFDETILLFLHQGHYSLIKSFSRFVGGQRFVCSLCLTSYVNRECFNRHCQDCRSLNPAGSRCAVPKRCPGPPGDNLGRPSCTRFTNYAAQKRLPVVIYADFEASLEHVDPAAAAGNKTPRGAVAVHCPNSFRLTIVSDVDLGIPLDYAYTGTDCDVKFIELLVKDLERIITAKLQSLAEQHSKPVLTAAEEAAFQQASVCRFCNLGLNGDDKVRDHCHFTGRYEGAAHFKCNIKSHQLFKGKPKIPVLFHNANYDMRCFMSAFRKIKGDENLVKSMGGVPCNMEVFKCLNINSFVILDSYAHLSSSLSKLIENLPEERKQRLRSILKPDQEHLFPLICQKGQYPYEHIKSVERLDIRLTDLHREHFDSQLTLSKLSDDEWAYVQRVISSFGLTTFREYHDLYLKIDVYGLADVFEYYRELSMDTYGLDPAHFIGLPSFTWQAGLKYTHVELENICDLDMYLFLEKWKRGGISVISHKYAKANNPLLPDYDPTEESSYLLQLDANNLYGWAMCQCLPLRDFRWIDADEMTTERILRYDGGKSSTGFALEVDLEYPAELHDEHNDYPLAPEHLTINGVRKLAPNFHAKTKYVVHVENLQFYLKRGLVLTKIHRVLQFEQQAWLKPYIDHNSALRQRAKNDFEKDYYKLLNNAFYGKTMENVRDRVNVQFCFDKHKFRKHTQSPLFANSVTILQEDGLALVKTHRKTVMLDKPIYIGAAVLDLSKLLMFDFHYNVMRERYPQSRMVKTDTDSLLYWIPTADLYGDLQSSASLQRHVEFSNYPREHFLYDATRKKQVGLFQDECVDGELAVISEYVGLRAKSYVNRIYLVDRGDFTVKKKCKGVNRRHLQQRVGFDDYLGCQRDLGRRVVLGDAEAEVERHRGQIYSFRAHKLQTYSVLQSKVALSGLDDKRVLLRDGATTLALGHWRITASA